MEKFGGSIDYFVVKAIYKKIKEKATAGDCVLVDCEGIIGDGIEWLENGKVSHVAICDGKGMIIEATDTGVKLSSIDKYANRKYKLMIRRIPDLTEEQRKKMVETVSAYIGKPYDFFQVITLGIYLLLRKLFGIRWKWVIGQSKVDMMICSELFIKGCIGIGIDLFPGTNIKEVTPDMLYDTVKLITIKELSYASKV